MALSLDEGISFKHRKARYRGLPRTPPNCLRSSLWPTWSSPDARVSPCVPEMRLEARERRRWMAAQLLHDSGHRQQLPHGRFISMAQALRQIGVIHREPSAAAMILQAEQSVLNG